jgi:predicted aconitase with swiveling domain
VGAAVADELYRVQIPIAVLAESELAELRTGDRVTVSREGEVRIA